MSNINKNKGIKHSFVQRLTWRIIAVLFLVIVFFSSLICLAAKHTLFKVTERYFTEMTKGNMEYITRHISDIPTDSIDKSQWLEGKLRKRDRQKNLESIFIDESDENVFYSFIIDRQGAYVVHPEKPGTLDNSTVRLILDDHQEPIESKMNGKDVVIFHQKFLDPDWIIVLVVPTYFVEYVINRLVIGMIALILFCLLAVYFASRGTIKSIASPLVSFAEATKEIAKGNFGGTLPKVDSEDEIGLLHDSFANMQHSLTQYVEELKETTASKAAIEEELRIASNIQMSMMPKKFPPYPERKDLNHQADLSEAFAPFHGAL